MKLRAKPTLPLGIDIGASAVRVALVVQRPDGAPELVAVATRPRTSTLGRTLIEAIDELDTHERRCVLGLGEPAALLRLARFPHMRRAELDRAVRFEASRLIDFPIAEATVRSASLNDTTGAIAIGITRTSTLNELSAAARTAKLRVVAVDHQALALRRALPDDDAVLDIGLHASRLYILKPAVPVAYHDAIGGATFTKAVAQAFGMDEPSAERRKRSHGITASANDVRDRFINYVAASLIECRVDGHADIRNLALVGNGSRLDDLAESLESATAVRVRRAVLAPHVAPALPPDVVRAAAPDWSQAFGLALWEAA